MPRRRVSRLTPTPPPEIPTPLLETLTLPPTIPAPPPEIPTAQPEDATPLPETSANPTVPMMRRGEPASSRTAYVTIFEVVLLGISSQLLRDASTTAEAHRSLSLPSISRTSGTTSEAVHRHLFWVWCNGAPYVGVPPPPATTVTERFIAALEIPAAVATSGPTTKAPSAAASAPTSEATAAKATVSSTSATLAVAAHSEGTGPPQPAQARFYVAQQDP
ncbi:uncharacterized protein LOC131230471 [Magnolia sinica]|uniref:uncharacterized protein LOC131230471 n=1 Tax=Magnolia sinica TaxID=86752 RepID=UPI00265926F1|nr:uncharacterized protein LOC131230471 [Magnolia sinica]